MKCIVQLSKIKKGKNNYHLIFTGYIHRIAGDRQLEFDYIGSDVEITPTTAIHDSDKQKILEALEKDFGYPPFDNFQKCKKIFGGYKEYSIEL